MKNGEGDEGDIGVPSTTMVMADPDFLYYPLWDVNGNEVFGYLCEALWDIGTGEHLPEDAIRNAFSDPGRLLAIDLETLRKSTGQVGEVVECYGFMKVLIPVHYSTISTAEYAEAYIDACNELVWPVLDYLFFEIVRPPDPLSPDGLTQIIERISPYGGGVMLRVGPGFDDFDNIPRQGLLSVGLDLRGGPLGEQQIIAELKRFAAGASACGLRSHVHGLDAVTTSVAAISAGFDFVGSDDIAPALDDWQPDDDKVKPADLLQTLLKSRQAKP